MRTLARIVLGVLLTAQASAGPCTAIYKRLAEGASEAEVRAEFAVEDDKLALCLDPEDPNAPATTEVAPPSAVAAPPPQPLGAAPQLASNWEEPWYRRGDRIRGAHSHKRIPVIDLARELGDTQMVALLRKQRRTARGAFGGLAGAGSVLLLGGAGITGVGFAVALLGLATLSLETMYAGLGMIALGALCATTGGIALAIGATGGAARAHKRWDAAEVYSDEDIDRGIRAHNLRIGASGRF